MPAPDSFSLSLPKAGGSLHGIGETFQANAFAGTANISLPIALSPGRSGFTPSLTLGYSAGFGNGPFGLGWQLSLPEISRKTERGVPRYDDIDTFVLSGSEDLVPAWRRAAADPAAWEPDEEAVGAYRVQRFRPRTEGRFSRIERWTDAHGDAHWRVTTGDNVTSIYGRSAAGRVADPDAPRRVFRWLLEETFDPRGNHARYEYAADAAPTNPGLAERRRRYAQRYLRRVLYANAPDGALPPDAPAPRRLGIDHERPLETRERTYLIEAVLDYGDIDGERYPQTAGGETATSAWPVRDDPFSTYRPGFELRTLRRCQRILVFHHFPEAGGTIPVRATELTYQIDPDTKLSLLTAATPVGYAHAPGGGMRARRLPPTTLAYAPFAPEQRRYATLDAAEGGFPSRAVYGPDVAFVDVLGDGLPAVVQSTLGGWRYWRNLGSGRFDRPRAMGNSPAGATLAKPGVRFGDAQGDGRPDLLDHSVPMAGFYGLDDRGGWQRFRRYPTAVAIDLADRNLRLVDLSGDGRSDALVSAPESFVWFENLGEGGFAPPRRIARTHDLDLFPDVSFDDPHGRVRLADMNGDGLADIVAVHDGAIEYWPNLGHGRFGPRVRMATAPRLGHPIEPARLFLVDLDGSGAADLVYVEFDCVRYWRNQSGNGWSQEREITGTPPATSATALEFADVFGTGTATLVWSYELAPQVHGHHKALDFCGGVKPHLLVAVDNGLGAVTRMRHAPSTRFYLDDLVRGRPWKTALPFPVHVLEETEITDQVSGTRLVTRYAYHHGVWDGREREFRGFACVDQIDTEVVAGIDNVPLRRPPVLTRTWYHPGLPLPLREGEAARSAFDARAAFADEFYRGDPGAFDVADVILSAAGGGDPREATRALRGRELRVETYALDDTPRAGHPYSVTVSSARTDCLQPPRDGHPGVYLMVPDQSLTHQYERTPDDPRVSHDFTLRTDAFGHPTDSVRVFYPRRHVPAELPEQGRLSITWEHADYINQASNRAAHYVGLAHQTRRYEITGVAWPGAGGRMPLGAADLLAVTADPDTYDPYNTTPAPAGGPPRKRLIHWTRTYYRKDAGADALDAPDSLAGRLPAGVVEPRGLVYDTYEAAFSASLLTSIFGARLDGLDAPARGGFHPRPAHGAAEAGAAGYFWIPAGRKAFDPARFFVAHRSADCYGNVYSAVHDRYGLLIEQVRDPLDNVTAVRNDYRVLRPFQLTDPNGNIRQVAYDALAFPVGVAEMGKEVSVGHFEGDSLAGFVTDLDPGEVAAYLTDPAARGTGLLGAASSRVVYDYERFRAGQGPVVMAHIVRSLHSSASSAATLQHTVTYSDGAGRSVQAKVLVEPDPASPGTPRWLASGTTVYDNKGKPVRRFEPFFSASPAFGLASAGAAVTLFLDPLGRTIGTHQPNETYRKVLHSAWYVQTWDENDTVLLDPRTDPDLQPIAGPFFATHDAAHAAIHGAPPRTWYAARTASADPRERRAAALTAAHAGTPLMAYQTPLGRSFLEVAENGTERLASRVQLDVEGQALEHTDPLGRHTLVQHFDLAGRRLAYEALDAGAHHVFLDAAGTPLFRWNARGHRVETRLDALQRPVETWVHEASSAPRLVQRVTHGEGRPGDRAANLRGQIAEIRDEASVALHDTYDFKGNLTAMTRRFLADHAAEPDWATDPAVDAETFRVITRYDALNRVVEKVTSRSTGTGVYRQEVDYHGVNLVAAIRVATPDEALRPNVSAIAYNAQGQRVSARLGNGVTLAYAYEPDTLRLSRVEARRDDGSVVQDLSYTYDPIGNVVAVRDNAQPAVFNHNAIVDPMATFEYDPVYRLVAATGREHEAAVGCGHRTAGAVPPYRDLQPVSNGQALLNYQEAYRYDRAGNLERIVHANSLAQGWTRAQTTDPAGNGLLSSDSGCPGEDTFRFEHDPDGHLLAMPHLPGLTWSPFGRLRAATLSGSTSGVSDRAVYGYSFDGTRMRKTLERAGRVVQERLYLGAFEIFREWVNGVRTLERETFHVLDAKRRVAQIDRLTVDTRGRDPGPAQRVRYPLDNHLQSTLIELDESAQVVSLEEFYPYGGTAYLVGTDRLGAEAKRYRHAGKERDDETGLYYYGARYYASWLGRWISADAVDAAGGDNLYTFVSGNPIGVVDPQGLTVEIVSTVEAGLKRLGELVEDQNKMVKANPVHQPVEHALIFDRSAPPGKQYQIILGHTTGVDPAPSVVAIAHTHPLDQIHPTIGDIRHITLTDQGHHAIVTGKNSWALIETFDPATGKPRLTVTAYYSGRQGSTYPIVGLQGNRGNFGAPRGTKAVLGWGVRGAGPAATNISDLAKLVEQSAQGSKPDPNAGPLGTAGRAVKGLDATGEVSRARQALTGAKNLAGSAARAGSVVLSVGGAGFSGFQIGDGIMDIADGNTAEGASKAGFGAVGLGLDIGGAYALKAGVITLGGPALLVGAAAIAAGGSLFLAQQTVDAAIKGEKTPYEVASDYWVDKALVWTGHDL
jgi:RHS repeat-associated protein